MDLKYLLNGFIIRAQEKKQKIAVSSVQITFPLKGCYRNNVFWVVNVDHFHLVFLILYYVQSDEITIFVVKSIKYQQFNMDQPNQGVGGQVIIFMVWDGSFMFDIWSHSYHDLAVLWDHGIYRNRWTDSVIGNIQIQKNFSIVDTRVTLILDVQHGDSSSVCYAVPTSVANHLSADYAITISLTVFSMLCLLFL